jgi:hypothetical protein
MTRAEPFQALAIRGAWAPAGCGQPADVDAAGQQRWRLRHWHVGINWPRRYCQARRGLPAGGSPDSEQPTSAAAISDRPPDVTNAVSELATEWNVSQGRHGAARRRPSAGRVMGVDDPAVAIRLENSRDAPRLGLNATADKASYEPALPQS